MRDIISNSDKINEATNRKYIVLLMIYYLSSNYINILSSLKQESIEVNYSAINDQASRNTAYLPIIH